MVDAYHEAVKRFIHLDPDDIAARSGSRFYRDRQRFEVKYFGSLYYVEMDGRVWTAAGETEIPFNDKTLILQYLVGASGLPPRGKWLSFLELPEGSHHHLPFKTDATNPLAKKFGDSRQRFAETALLLGGKPIPIGDAAFYIPALPKIPLAVIFWEGCDEFAAESNILFDSVSPTHLTTAALWVLGVELAQRMICFHNQILAARYVRPEGVISD